MLTPITPYIVADDAQTYFDDRLNTEPWDSASDDDKLKALKQATGLINNLRFRGYRSDPTQPNEFPRSGSMVVPDAIAKATCELALVLLDQVDPNLEIENTPITSEKYAMAGASYDRDFVMAHIRNGIPSSEAWAMLVPYLTDPLAVRLVRS
jgi:hypothetical protein